MMDVGGNDGAAARDFAAHKLRRQLLALGDVLHLFGDDALARKMHLRKIPYSAVHRRRSLLNPRIPHSHKAPVHTNP